MRSFAIALTCCLAACGSETTSSSPVDAASTETIADTASATDSASSDGATDSAMTSDASGQEKMICDALASRSACSGGAVACEASAKCIYGRLMLPAAASAYAACRSAPSCKSDDTCVGEAGKTVGGAAADKYTADCLAKLMTCAGSFKDDYCSPAMFAFSGSGAGAQECMAKPCDQVSACLASLQAIKDIAACK